jgi:flagellar assembly protein FliH
MPTVIRATQQNRGTHGVAFNLDDIAARAEATLDQVRAEARQILARAQQEADAVRKRAEAEGRQAARAEIEEMVRGQLATALPALRKAVEEIQHAKQAWLAQWERSAVHLAGAIAGRLIRRELPDRPEIPLTLVREALELAAGESTVRIHLHPDDYEAIAGQVKMLVTEMTSLGEAEVIPDTDVSQGGCRVETRFGVIDQQFEAQLARVEEELTGD